MKILALDQSSKITGYAVFNEKQQLLAYGKFDLKENSLGERLVKFKENIDDIIYLNKIDYVVFEDIQLQRNVTGNVKTFKALAEVIGVLTEYLTDKEIPFEPVLASVWKSCLDIKGRARAEQKKAAQEYVNKNYNIKPTQDECDAICIGTYYFNKEKEEILDWSE